MSTTIENAAIAMGYTFQHGFYVKLIGYGAVAIDHTHGLIKSLFKSATTGEVMTFASKSFEGETVEDYVLSIVEFETYNVKSTVYYHGPMTELMNTPQLIALNS